MSFFPKVLCVIFQFIDRYTRNLMAVYVV